MLKKFIHGRIDALASELQYDASYLHALLDTDLGAFMRITKLQGISTYRQNVPLDVWHCVRLAGAMVSDCGPCAQLMVTMAERDGVDASTLRAVASSNDAALSPDVRLGVQFARASLAHDPAADELREQVLVRWGQRGLVSLAFGLVAARVYPTLKYALGYGRACSKLQIEGKPVPVITLATTGGATA